MGSALFFRAVSEAQATGTAQRVNDAGRSEGHSVMEWIGIDFHRFRVKHIMSRESELTSYAGPTGKGNQVSGISTAWLRRFNLRRR